MSKELEAFVRLEQNSKRYKGRKQDLDIVFAALKEKENIEKTINELFSDNGKVITTIDIKKKLKALEIIKENLVVSCDESENDKSCLVIGFKVDKDKMAIIYHTFDKEKIDLLKEVLV